MPRGERTQLANIRAAVQTDLEPGSLQIFHRRPSVCGPRLKSVVSPAPDGGGITCDIAIRLTSVDRYAAFRNRPPFGPLRLTSDSRAVRRSPRVRQPVAVILEVATGADKSFRHAAGRSNGPRSRRRLGDLRVRPWGAGRHSSVSARARTSSMASQTVTVLSGVGIPGTATCAGPSVRRLELVRGRRCRTSRIPGTPRGMPPARSENMRPAGVSPLPAASCGTHLGPASVRRACCGRRAFSARELRRRSVGQTAAGRVDPDLAFEAMLLRPAHTAVAPATRRASLPDRRRRRVRTGPRVRVGSGYASRRGSVRSATSPPAPRFSITS